MPAVLAEIIDPTKAGPIFGYVDLQPTDRFEHPYLGDDSALDSFPPDGCLLVNGLGSVHLPVKRCDIFRRLSARGYRFMNVIHPRAVISPGARLQGGAQVLAGAVFNPGVTIGENCLINTGAVIDHDCAIGRHCHIAPGAVLSGAVRVGEGSHIGTGAKVVQGIEIGCRVLIGGRFRRCLKHSRRLQGFRHSGKTAGSFREGDQEAGPEEEGSLPKERLSVGERYPNPHS